METSILERFAAYGSWDMLFSERHCERKTTNVYRFLREKCGSRFAPPLYSVQGKITRSSKIYNWKYDISLFIKFSIFIINYLSFGATVLF